MDQSLISSKAAPREVQLAMALSHLRAYGPADAGTTLSISGVARALGLSRSSVYRWWATTEELADDVIVRTATVRRGWQQRLLDHDPSTPLDEAIVASLPEDSVEPGVLVRTWVSALGSQSRPRAVIAAWERAWLHEFADWLARRPFPPDLDPAAEIPWVDVALALAAQIEGSVSLHGYRAGVPRAALGAVVPRATAQAASNMFDELLAEARGPVVRIDPPDDEPSGTSEAVPANDRMLERIEAFQVDGIGSTQPPLPGRLVNLDRLARALDLSPRRLYDVWPTATDLNKDLVRAAISRHREATARLAMDAFGASSSGAFNHFTHLFISSYQAVIEGGRTNEARVHLAAAASFGDPTVVAEAGAAMAEWLNEQSVFFSAVLLTIDHELRPGITIDAHVVALVSSLVGAVRFAQLHPQVLERTVRYEDHDHPTLPVGTDAMTRASTRPRSEQRVPDPDARISAPPPLRTDGTAERG